jgi:hypothetical protein
VVWHHRRNSVRAYWKQQCGYGKAEALLERKWPEKYNAAGHLTWAGRIYGPGLTQLLGPAGRIYHGIWGSAPFQSVYQPAPGVLRSLPLMPEWYLVIAALVGLSALGALWPPLLLALPLLACATGAPLAQAALSAARAAFPSAPPSRSARLKLRGLTALLHLLQPLARLRGRLGHGLTPWRHRGGPGLALPWPRTFTLWSKRWQEPTARLRAVETALRAGGAVVVPGGDHDRWDLAPRGGLLGAARLLVAVEEHGSGRQLVRVRAWPRVAPKALALVLVLAGLAAGAALGHAWVAAALLGAAALLLALRAVGECAAATAAVLRALDRAHGSHDSAYSGAGSRADRQPIPEALTTAALAADEQAAGDG